MWVPLCAWTPLQEDRWSPPPYQQPCPRGSKYHKLHISDTSYHKATTPILFFFFLFFLPHQPSTIHERMLFQLFSQACRSILTHHCGVFCLWICFTFHECLIKCLPSTISGSLLSYYYIPPSLPPTPHSPLFGRERDPTQPQAVVNPFLLFLVIIRPQLQFFNTISLCDQGDTSTPQNYKAMS